MKTIYLDTETTGLKPTTSRIVEIALVNADGATLLHTLVDPGMPIPAEATAIHGITDADVAGAPKLIELLPAVLGLARGNEVVIYNSAYDTQFLPGLSREAAAIRCAMLRAQDFMRVSRWPKLIAAAEWAGYTWAGKAHSALADTLACRHVWLRMEAIQAGEAA